MIKNLLTYGLPITAVVTMIVTSILVTNWMSDNVKLPLQRIELNLNTNIKVTDDHESRIRELEKERKRLGLIIP